MGYANLNSPKIDLAEHGFHFQGGVNIFRWSTVGFDYSRSSGDLLLTSSMALPSVQQKLATMLGALAAAGRLPAGYTVAIPTSSITQTFAGGPQLIIRHWKPVTVFIRPSIGAIYEEATPHPGDAIAVGIVNQLAPSGRKTDLVPFYGIGGGFDLNVSRHFALRVQADYVHDYLFDDLLAAGRNTVRFSIGPAFRFGRNIAK